MSDIITKKILVLGSRWSGKSLLIKRLEDICSSTKTTNDDFLYTTTTIGKTLTTIKYKRNQAFELHELGATLGCLWKTFYMSTHFDKIIYVVDSTQPWSISFTFEQLKEISEQIPIKPKNILLVFNKINEINSLNKTALIELLDLNSFWNGEVDIIETNARTGTNLSSLLDWLTR
jgi:signal recognition particle receptor subunit beta